MILYIKVGEEKKYEYEEVEGGRSKKVGGGRSKNKKN